MGYSKDSEMCKHCEHYNDCSNKRMVACAFIIPELSLSSQQPLTQEMILKHEYREVLIAKNTSVTIDLKEIQKKLTEEISLHWDAGICKGNGRC